MRTADFDYVLPPELIAQAPPPERTAARMLVLDRATGGWAHRRITDLGACLAPGDLLVLNDTRVIPARLLGQRHDTGGRFEVFLLEPCGDDVWEALYRSAARPRPGIRVDLAGGRLTGTVREVLAGGRMRVALQAGTGTVADAIAAYGLTPIPPYIRRDGAAGAEMARLDRERYQTVYARVPGAVAAPTAGLHFTPDLLAGLRAGGLDVAYVTLHVGPGTFKPVKAADVADHAMEAERYDVSAATAVAVARARARGGRVVAVGSTTVRTLETVARERGEVAAGTGRSSLFIHPPYPFRAVDCMLTNFHLPQSTLLMMVSAFCGAGAGSPDAGRDLALRAYAEAIRERYRFYSYGDCMLIR